MPKMKAIGCAVHGILRAKPEKRDAMRAILERSLAPTRRGEGGVDYHLHVSDPDANLFMFDENWRSRAHLDHPRTLPHLAPIRERSGELLAAEVEIIAYTMLSLYGR